MSGTGDDKWPLPYARRKINGGTAWKQERLETWRLQCGRKSRADHGPPIDCRCPQPSARDEVAFVKSAPAPAQEPCKASRPNHDVVVDRVGIATAMVNMPCK